MKKSILWLLILVMMISSACSQAETPDTTDTDEVTSEQEDTDSDEPEVSDEPEESEAPAPEEDTEEPAADDDGLSGEVTIFHRFVDSHQVALETGLAYCQDQYPDIQIEISNVSGAEYEVQLPIALSSDNPPDIYALWPGGRPIFQAENGRIATITDFYNESIAPIYVEGVNKGVVETDGEIYVMPFNVMPNAFYYRTDVFEELNLEPPETWDEFVAVLDAIKESGTTPIALGSGRGWEPLFWFDYMVLRVAGAEFREDLMWGNESYNSPEVVEAMTRWQELLEAGYFNEDITSFAWADMTPMVAEGRAAMMLMGPWAVNTLSEAGLTPGEDFDMFPFPNIYPDIPDATEGAMEGWATTGARDNKEEVEAILECVASAEQQTVYAELAVRPMPNPEITLDVYSEEQRPFITRLAGLNDASFHQNMELATLPPITDIAKREFPRFLTFPDQYETVLTQLDNIAQESFAGGAFEPVEQEEEAMEAESSAEINTDISGDVTLFHRFVDTTQIAIETGLEYCAGLYPNINLEISNVSGAEYEVQLPIALSSDNPPDIYALWPGGRPIFQSQNGRIATITDFYNESIAPLYVEGVNKGVVETDGEIYVMPFNVMPNAFYYRTDVFEELNLEPPETWDEFVAVLDAIKESGTTPIALGSGRGWEPLFWFDYMVLRVAGAEFREDLMWGKVSYTDPKVIEAMEMWGELLEAGYFNEDITSFAWADMTPMVAEGRAAMMLMGPWAVNTLSEAGLTPGEDFDMFPFPNINPDIPDATEGAMEGWATTGARDNAEAVEAILSCVASTEHQTIYAEIAVRPMPNPEITLDVYSEDQRPFITRLAGLNDASFHQNMELATIPPVTDIAKREFPRFLTFPDQFMTVLEQLDDIAQSELGE